MDSKKSCQNIQVCYDDEILHILRNLKQRFSEKKVGRNLIYRIEKEVKKRYIPRRNKTIEEIYCNITNDSFAQFNKMAFEIHNILNFDSYSEFQFYGWKFVYDALTNKFGLIISAPTGSGKTETFIPPLILKIIHEFKKGNDFMSLIVYPRISLLKEQAKRIFKYIYKAQQILKSKKDIVVGLQFGGIASSINSTLQNTGIFHDNEFSLFKCPICNNGKLSFKKNRGRHILECKNCRAEWKVSLSKETHIKNKPNILITTFESLDRLFLHPKFEDLFKRIEAIFIDEVHLFHGIYGAHISNFIKNIEGIKKAKIAKIGISATIANPKEFGSKLFYKKEKEENLYVLTADKFDKEENGCEFIYFIKANQQENASLEASAFIQTAIAVGHGILKPKEQALAFIDSIDLVKRFKGQIKDAEDNKKLWSFRILKNEIEYNGLKCPENQPCECEIYENGECWRVINLGRNCYQEVDSLLKKNPLKVEEVSSKSSYQDVDNWEEADLILSTPSLEVGIDKDTILATLHYRAPRSVFSFIQRRGRAGRKSDKAYTFIVLGNTSMDNFYFYKRHRLLDETRYSLPLNPQNEIIKQMHNQLISQRDKLLKKYNEYGGKALEVIKNFIIDYFEKCALLRDIYADIIEKIKTSDSFINDFAKWIKEEKTNLETYFNIEQIIRFIKEEVNVNEINNYADQLLNAIKNNNLEEIEKLQNEISIVLSEKELELKKSLGIRHEEVKEFREMKNELEKLLEQIGKINLNIKVINNVENYYLFFKTLIEKLEYGKNNWVWKSRSIPDVVKAFFQASFYLHLNLKPGQDKTCPFSKVDFYLPDAYFQEVKPIVVEVRRGKYTSEFILEDSSMLEYMLIPYKAIYRYSGDEFINIVDTGKNNLENISRLDNETYEIIIPIRYKNIKGIDRGDSFEVSSIKVKSLKTDSEGKQTLKICPECFTLYSFTKVNSCHTSPLQSVRIDAKPISRKEVKIETLEETFQFSLDKIQARILIEGSDVKVFRTIVKDGKIFPTKDNIYNLKIRYEKPLSYTLISKGIRWKIKKNILEKLSDSEKEKFLHTGAHLLLKVVATLGGVHEQILQYHFNSEKGEIYIWERYEGGIGVVDVVFNKIKENPIEVYKEFVSNILCPIHYSHKLKTQKIDNIDNFLKNLVRENFYLGEDEEIVSEFINEVKIEIEKLQDNEEGFICQDGCPICIHINYCQAGFSQQEQVSRQYAENLVKNLIEEKEISSLKEEDLIKILVRTNNKVFLLNM